MREIARFVRCDRVRGSSQESVHKMHHRQFRVARIAPVVEVGPGNPDDADRATDTEGRWCAMQSANWSTVQKHREMANNYLDMPVRKRDQNYQLADDCVEQLQGVGESSWWMEDFDLEDCLDGPYSGHSHASYLFTETTLGYDFRMVLEFRTIRLLTTYGSLLLTGKLSLPNRAFRFFCHD